MSISNNKDHAGYKNDDAHWDELFNELKNAIKRSPDNNAARKCLADVLFDNVCKAGKENNPARRDMLMQELRVLADAFPDDATVRDCLASGLNNVIAYAEEDYDDIAHWNDFLKELRDLHDRYPNDKIFRTIVERASELL